MPLRKDETGKRWVEMELLVAGTPEQVWEAMATGPGNAAWFVKAEIEPRVGGAFVLDFGQGSTTSGEVTTWEPPRRFGYVEREWAPGAPPIATEITITRRSDDRCVMRMIHSLEASTDEWDNHIERFEAGWPGFFAVLRAYLEHFAGTNAASFLATASASSDSLSTWLRLGEALGLTAANVGERRETSSGAESWSGVVEHVYQDAQQRYVLLRLDGPSPGIVLVGTYDKGVGTHVSVCRYFYGADATKRAAECEPRWRDWLTETFGEKSSAKE